VRNLDARHVGVIGIRMQVKGMPADDCDIRDCLSNAPERSVAFYAFGHIQKTMRQSFSKHSRLQGRSPVVDLESDSFLQAARQALDHFPIKSVDVSLVARAENITFRVADDRGDLYTLGLHRPTYHTLEELQSERLWTRALLQAGVHVPEPITTRDGRDYAGVDVPQLRQHRHASLSRWVPGELLMQLIRDETPRRTAGTVFPKARRVDRNDEQSSRELASARQIPASRAG